ncbi:MAG: ABC transporter ATP-binding protein [Tepidisphaeraceae bacterium]
MSPLLEAQHLSARYGKTPVLAGVDLRLNAGEILALIGPNGSGKTTLLRALLGHAPSEGDIRWFGRPQRDWPRHALARQVAYLSQFPSYEPTDRVIEILRLGRLPFQGVLGIESEADEGLVRATADALDLTALLDRPLHAMSGGQRQRVFLGRALIQEPRVLLLDEPGSSLDLKHRVELHARLKSLAAERGMGIVMTTHDFDLTAAHATHVLLLRQGRTISYGDTATVMTEANLSAAFETPLTRVESRGSIGFLPIP